MEVEHDREMAAGKSIGRAGDVQVQTLELVLLERLLRDNVFGQAEELLFVALGLGLRTDGAAGRQRHYVRVNKHKRTRSASRP